MKKIILILTLIMSSSLLFANSLYLSDGNFDVNIDYGVGYTYGGTCANFDPKKITVTSRNGEVIENVEVLIDTGAQWLENGNTDVIFIAKSKCNDGSSCELVDADFHKAGWICFETSPLGDSSNVTYHNIYARILVNGQVLQDPYAPSWRKSVFQLMIQK